MKIIIDADGCPVVRLAVGIARRHGIPTLVVCDTSHEFFDVGEVITVSKGADSVDYKIANTLMAGDIVVTQDYGLAAMCLARGARPLSQNGLIFTADNIDSLLNIRAESARIRRSGARLKGPKKRLPENDEAFEKALKKLIKDSHEI